jgi:hypothetical protein
VCCIQHPKLLQEKIQNSNSHVLTPQSKLIFDNLFFNKALKIGDMVMITQLCAFVYIKSQHVSFKEGSYITVFTLKLMAHVTF